MLSGFIWLMIRLLEGFCESGSEGEIEFCPCGDVEFNTSWTWCGFDWFHGRFGEVSVFIFTAYIVQ